MSIQTWKNEFYPIDADEFRVGKTALEAARHSLKKWQGLLRSNLEKHNLRWSRSLSNTIVAKRYSHATFNQFTIYGSSCSLCHMFLHGDEGIPHATLPGEVDTSFYRSGCAHCPLAITMQTVCGGTANDPWTIFVHTHDPSAMIKALQETVVALEKLEEAGAR